MQTLAGVPKLFLAAADDPELGSITQQMFLQAPEPRKQEFMAHGNLANLEGADKRNYENQITSFFLSALPVSAKGVN
jgi:hypothetical protein